MPVAAIAILAVLGAIVFGSALFLLIGFILAGVSGWLALAGKYRASAPPQGTRHASVSARIGPVNYNAMLTVYVSAQGLYLAAMALFRWSHRDLFIPWSAVTARRDGRNIFYETVELSIGQPAITGVILPKRILAEAPA